MLIILAGKSASGKDTLREYMLAHFSNYRRFMSVTTRPKRPDEQDGVAYYFVTDKEFDKIPMIEKKTYHTLVAGVPAEWKYGTAKNAPYGNDVAVADYIAIKDPKGAWELKRYYGDTCRIIYLKASDELRTKRAQARAGYDKTEWLRRVKADAKDFENIEDIYDYTIDSNESLETMADIIYRMEAV